MRRDMRALNIPYAFQAAGIKGKRFGSGFLMYPPEKKKAGLVDSLTSMLLPKPKRTPNPAALAAMKPFMKTHKIADEEIQKRVVARFVNEAIFCLQDKIIRNPVSTHLLQTCKHTRVCIVVDSTAPVITVAVYKSYF
jgi:hypothetical protein